MDRYAVFGNPIAHSKSPEIHQHFAMQTSQTLVYEKRLVALDQFAQAATEFKQSGGRGLNITVPFKEEAFDWVDHLDPMAQRAGAVNTIAFKDNRTLGYNTDGLGLVRDLMVNHQIALKDQNILILGAGGAVRGVLEPILAKHPTSLTIANRTVSKAETLASAFDDLGQLIACGYDDLSRLGALDSQGFDIIINGTAASLSGELPPLPDGILKQGGTSYDMVYSKTPTAFVEWGKKQGAHVALDGLGMLLEQAAEAFAIWRGIRPDTRQLLDDMTS